jgi:hypothetical protein
MTPSTWAVAVCWSRASRVSVMSRVFSIAMTARSAKVRTSSICRSVKGSTRDRTRIMRRRCGNERSPPSWSPLPPLPARRHEICLQAAPLRKLAHARRDDEQPVRLAVVGRQLCKKLVVGHPRRRGQTRRQANASGAFFTWKNAPEWTLCNQGRVPGVWLAHKM